MGNLTEKAHINWAAWTGLDAGVVSFTSDWEKKHLPEFWWGEDQLPLKSVRRYSPEQFGLKGGYYGRKGTLYFVLADSLIKEFKDEDYFLAGSFNGWTDAIGKDEWKLSPDVVSGKACHVLELPGSRLEGVEYANFKFVSASGRWVDVPEYAKNTHVDKMGIKNYLFSQDRTGRHLFHFKTPLPLTQGQGRLLYVRIGETVESIRLNPGVFLKTMDAEGPFGAIARGDETVFRLFAPRAKSVCLYLYEDLDKGEGEPVEMELSHDQVWEASFDRNYHGWYYHYKVTGQEVDEVGYFDPDFKVLDPFAKAVCGPLGPGIVVDSEYFATSHPPFQLPSWHDLVIAETHVRDLTANAPIDLTADERLGFSGLNKWIEHHSFYLKQLGVNAVELQPVHEFDTVDKHDYGWGYMPVNFFSPASQYSLNPAKLSQVDEFRETVHAFHMQGMAVILDVVYNHVGEPNYLQYLDREYYFLLARDGQHENHSGCGNTLDASTPVARRLIRDSLVHWIKAYDVDGFRFDLADLIGVPTLAWLEKELKAVKEGIILIAEPWSFRGHSGKDLRSTGIASWNDGYREYVRKYLSLQADSREAPYFMGGSTPDLTWFPAQTINYVASHDDHCWIDKITQNPGHDGHRPTDTDRRRTHIMAGMLMMSLGTPMLLAGIEMMKSKGGVSNTYLRGDLNAIPYGRMAEYSGTVEYIRRWVAFRLGSLGRYVRLYEFPGRDYIVTTSDGVAHGILINTGWTHGNERLIFVMNPGYEYTDLEFEGVRTSRFIQLADTERWGDPALKDPNFSRWDSAIKVPPLSCGLFMESK